ncbi:MAG TPA: PKD domain-containing protein [Ferruginibacter sp.]|nr:PKD domain-containing protein [Ferruginibacter sp.]
MLQRMATYFLLIFAASFVAQSSYAQLQFVENKGQWDKAIVLKADISTGAFFLQKNGFSVLLNSPADLLKLEETVHGDHTPKPAPDTSKSSVGFVVANSSSATTTSTTSTTSSQPVTIHSHFYTVEFVGASDNVEIVPEKGLPTYNNYFIGNDTTKWQSNCKIYQAVTYKNIYPNIDVHYYTTGGTLKYDIIIRPGGNPNDIVMKYAGVGDVQVKNKELIITTSVGETKELYPYTYQLQGDNRVTLDCKYQVRDSTVRFKIKEHADGSTIVIDPTLIFSSFTGSTADNWGYTATPGPDGSFYAGGIVFNNGGSFPTSPGSFQQTFNGGVVDDEIGYGYDISIIKFSANGDKRLYGTYLGGEGNEQPHSMICDAQGNLIITGRSCSPDYPIKPSTNSVYESTNHNTSDYDIIVTKFNSTGTGIIGSIKIGGTKDDGVNIRGKYVPPPSGTPDGAGSIRRNYGDDARGEVILDAGNNIIVASCTQSNNFPVINTGIQTSFAGTYQDGVVLKFAPDLSSITFSTYFGGTGDDACFAAAIDPITGNLYIGGSTTSTNLPGNKTGVTGPNYFGGLTDGYVTELQPDGSAIIKTTYAGTNGDDMLYGLKFDRSGFPYIMGSTTGDWPIINAAFSNPGSKQFIAKLKPDLSSYVYSTIFGTNANVPNISPVAFLVDRCENVYISGWGGSFDNGDGYPSVGTSGMTVTANAIQKTTDGNDFYFFVLEKNANSQLFGSFFGQDGGFADHVDGGTSRFDDNGIIYQAVCANCYGKNAVFPVTPGVWAPKNGTGTNGCNEAAVKIAMNFAGITAGIKTIGDGISDDSIGCLPFTVELIDTGSVAKKYMWNYGDGSAKDTTTSVLSSHVFNTVGVFTVMLIAEDSIKCNIRDTAYKTIRVSTNSATANFTYAKTGVCSADLNYVFTNLSTDVTGTFSPKSFVWNYGDGSPNDTLSLTDTKNHTFASAGSYVVTLCVIDSLVCNEPACTNQVIRIASNVKAQIATPAKGCAAYTAIFNNTSLGGTSFAWNFDDPASGALNTSTDISPTHIYNKPGTYIIKLIATDNNTCNKIDSTTFIVVVSPKPVAQFSWSPNPPVNNTPTQFTNTSTGATKYFWDFDENSNTSTEFQPSYQFNLSTTFHVCLQAINDEGCIDTACQDISAIITPLLDVPNAFTPSKPGNNSVIKVEGFGIGIMDWKIYNRWGQLVFESTNKENGWDGTFKGVLQPMDVYTYTLQVQYTDNKLYTKTGDITLIR